MAEPKTYEEWDALEQEVRAALARQDYNHFLEYVLDIHQASIHRDLQAHFSAGLRQGVLLPRNHGKTTQSVGRLAWEVGKNPNLRVKIVCESNSVATGRAKSLREIIESPRYRKVFPHIVPGRTWTDEKFSVQRSLISPDETVHAYGVSSSVLGGRADLILFDDVVGPDAIRSEASRERTRELIDNAWMLLLEEDGRAWYIATPWHTADYTEEVRKRKAWDFQRWPIGPNFEPVWDEKWPCSLLEKQKASMPSVAYARAYLLQPLSEEDSPIKAEWFNFYTRKDIHPYIPSLYRFLGVDLAISKSKTAAYTVFVDIGKQAETNRKFVLRILRKRMDFPSAVSAFNSWVREVQYRGIGIETVAFQRAFAETVDSSGVSVHEFQSTESKHERAAALSLPIERGEVYLLGQNGIVDPSQQVLFDECTYFPVAQYKDCLDALGFAVEVADKLGFAVDGERHVSAYSELDDYPGKRIIGARDFL